MTVKELAAELNELAKYNDTKDREVRIRVSHRYMGDEFIEVCMPYASEEHENYVVFDLN